jgi:hypothetical protein
MIVDEGVGYGKSEMIRKFRKNKDKENRWDKTRRRDM